MEILQGLPDAIGETVLVVLVLSSFAGSFITAAFGIGGGGFLLAVMATLVPVAALIPVHGLVQLGSNAGRTALFFQSISWSVIPAFGLGSALGSVAGGMVVIELPSAWVQIGVGCFVIWTVFARPPVWMRDFPVITGAVSSFLTMFFGATGLFVASFTKSRNLPRHAHVATHATLMTIQHSLKVIVFGVLGFAFSQWWAVVIFMILAGGLGTWAGRHVLNRMNDRGFRKGLDILLVLISARLVWVGVAELI